MIASKLCGAPKDIYSATYFIFLINRLLGTAPFALESAPKHGYKMDKLSMVGSIIKVLAIIIGMVVNISMGDRLISPQVHRAVNLYFGLLSSTFIICACFRSKMVIVAFKLIDDIDEKLKSLGIWMNYRMVRRNINIHLLIMMGLALIFIAIECEITSSVAGFSSTLVVTWVPQIMILSVELQYFHYLNLALDRYKILNEYLEALEKEKETFFEPADVVSAKPLRPRQLSAGLLKSTKRTSDPIFILQTISELHIQLTDMCGLFEKAFSIQLLVRIGISFITITTCLFYFFVDLGTEFNYIKEHVHLLSACFVLVAGICVAELFSLAWISDATCREANSCPLYLHKLKHKCKGDLIQEIIELYSVQMYHNKLQFTVCGLFPLDHSLLYSMTGAVTTYLIFLVQFDKMADARKTSALNITDNATILPLTEFSTVNSHPL